MTEKKPVSFRMRPDRHETIEQWREEQGLQKTDAYRRLIEAGLEVEVDTDASDGSISERRGGGRGLSILDLFAQPVTVHTGLVLLLAGALSMLAAVSVYSGPASPLAAVFAVLSLFALVVAALLSVLAAASALALNRPLRSLLLSSGRPEA